MDRDVAIRRTMESDLDEILRVEREAFGQDEEAELTRNLLNDPSAAPLLSLLARGGEHAVGHILFTTTRLTDTPDTVSSMILAPLAVVPAAQRQGVGGRLIREGLRLLTESGVDFVFVLGSPDYYPRHGFKSAFPLNFRAPYPIPEKWKDAWMVQALRPGGIACTGGTVLCADALNRPEYWVE